MKTNSLHRILLLFLLLFPVWPAVACEVCEKEQPEITRGLTHGTGPQSLMEYGIIILAAIIVSVTLYYSIRYLWNPREGAPNHIKNIIKEDYPWKKTES